MVGCLHINRSRNRDVVDAQQALDLGSVCVRAFIEHIRERVGRGWVVASVVLRR